MKQNQSHEKLFAILSSWGIKTIPPYDEKYDYSNLTKHLKTRYFKKIVTHNIFTDWHSLEKHIEKTKKLGIGVTEKKMILLYGPIEGLKRWDAYRNKQAFTNTFEYKSKKYGMTKHEFDDYNKKRAVTKENLLKRHGDNKGTVIWENYVKRQAYTNSKEYLGDRYEDVNSRKSHTIENYMKKYGLDETQASKKLENFFSSSKKFYSKDSQNLFWEIYNNLSDFEKTKSYFAELNKEYAVFCKKESRIYLYDFVCSELQLCIEYHGDHYHGNPKIYTPSQFLRGRGQSKIQVCEVWQRDEIKNKAIKDERNYDLLVIWESDWKKDKEKVISKIMGVINEKRSILG